MVVMPTRTAGSPARAAGSPTVVGVPVAVAVPVIVVTGLAVVVAVVVAATPVPVVTPTRVPPLARAPVVVGHRPGGAGERPGNARRAQTSKSKTRGEGSRGCDSFDVFHTFLVPRKPGRPNISSGDFPMNFCESAW